MFHTVYNSYETKPNGRDYIGKHSTDDPYDDYRGSFADKEFDPDSKIVFAYAKTAEGALWLEIQFQKVFGVVEDPQFANRAYQTSTGFDTTGSTRIQSEEAKQKMRKAATGRKPSKETLQKMREASTGRKLSEETKQKQREAATGRKHSKEAIQKMRDANTGENNPMFGRVGEKSPRFGKTHTDKANQKNRDAQIGKVWYVNAAGETLFQRENPGEGWQRGRKWKG